MNQASFVGTSALLLAVGIAGCSDANAPSDSLRGRYVLVSVDAKPLPVLLNDYSTARFYLVGDTLRFDGTAPHSLAASRLRSGRYCLAGA